MNVCEFYDRQSVINTLFCAGWYQLFKSAMSHVRQLIFNAKLCIYRQISNMNRTLLGNA